MATPSKAPQSPTKEQAASSPRKAGEVSATVDPRATTLAPQNLAALQRAAGNHAVSQMVGTIQRVAIANQPTTETLYNQTSGTGQATANLYSINANYEMTRAGDSGATVQVKIKFLSQSRNTVAPPLGAPANAPRVGQLVGPQTEIPANDPRRAWATTTAASAVTHWNGRLALNGEERNLFSANTPKHLPVNFQAVPVFGMDEEAHNTIIVHPPAVQGGSTGNPIDAGNYYMNKNDQSYPASDDIIYAHEYGHLLGIPDEYSQSNGQMNALLHQSAPAGAASAMAALDRRTVERMALAALSRPMSAQLRAAMPTITGAIRAQMALVKQKMAAAARTGVRDGAVRDELTAQITAAADASIASGIPDAVAFETTTNFSNITRASEGVDRAFAAAALQTQIGDAYWNALLAPHDTNVAVEGLGDVQINTSSAIYGAAGAGTPQRGAATGLAATTVGPAAAGGPGLPAIAPPASLVGQINAIPGAWNAAGSGLETGVTAGAFTEKMVAALRSAAAAVAAPPPGIAPPPRLARVPELWRRAMQLVTNSSTEAARQLAVDLITTTVHPVLTDSVAALQTSLHAEVERIMTTPPAGLVAAAAPDANMTAIVTAMRTRLDAAKAATAGTGRDPLGAGQAAPDQDVTYSYQGLMGSNATAALRADQFQPMVTQFNRRLKTFWERAFTAEVR